MNKIKVKGAVDAIEPLDVILKPRHCLHARRRDPENCIAARALNSIPNVIYARVFLNVTYIWFDDGTIKRYQNSHEMRFIAELNDKKGRRTLIDELHAQFEQYDNSVKLKLLPPRKTVQLDYIRSEKFKKLRAESKRRAVAGKPRRRYTKPSSVGLRDGSGRSHSLPGYTL
jgi:hypothetical protein